jgi:mannose-6-phosphate isomerase-like protein (cupin superfamily)
MNIWLIMVIFSNDFYFYKYSLTMKKTFSYLALSTFALISIGQTVLRPEKTETGAVYENVHVQKIAGDSLSSIFIIWIKKEVKLHLHQAHSEVVIILSGKGNMRLGKEKVKISKGDLVFIPKGTVHSVTATSRKPLKLLSIQVPHFDGTDRVFVGENGY